MKKTFYDVIKAKAVAGQYAMTEILGELALAYEKGYITMEQFEELKVLSETACDPNYVGNKYPTAYDLDQDITISGLDTSVLELFELVMGTVAVQTATQQAKITTSFSAMSRSAIGDTYVRVILRGDRTFSSVHPTKQQEVAEKLTALGRCDLIDVPEFHPPHADCPWGNTQAQEVQ